MKINNNKVTIHRNIVIVYGNGQNMSTTLLYPSSDLSIFRLLT